jgi:EAL domain-containing protein (putative c-di-GMP-specific phosphodiesterase class I)
MSTSRELESGRLGLDRAVEFAHRHLPFDVAYVAELRGGRQVYRAVAGDAASFNIVLDDGPALDHAAIGAYASVPVRLSDGTLYGTLCCLSRSLSPTIDERATQVLSMLAELIVDDLDELRRRDDLRRELTEVIEMERVDVAYQPIFDPRSDRCLGIEALARFPEPFGRPDETFAAAERVGLGLELERLVVSRAWEMIPRLGVGQFLAVNVSPATLLQLARKANRREELPLTKVVVEVTEHSAVEAYAALRDELVPLRERGLRVAVDDAGAGYASLRHVLELRPDFIKLDRWLIHGLADDWARRVAVGAFVSLARELGAKVVAEGVERPADLAVIRDLGLDAAQGYLLGRPTTDQDLVSRWFGALKSSEAPRSARGASPASPGRTRRARR